MPRRPGPLRRRGGHPAFEQLEPCGTAGEALLNMMSTPPPPTSPAMMRRATSRRRGARRTAQSVGKSSGAIAPRHHVVNEAIRHQDSRRPRPAERPCEQLRRASLLPNPPGTRLASPIA